MAVATGLDGGAHAATTTATSEWMRIRSDSTSAAGVRERRLRDPSDEPGGSTLILLQIEEAPGRIRPPYSAVSDASSTSQVSDVPELLTAFRSTELTGCVTVKAFVSWYHPLVVKFALAAPT